MSDKLYMGVDPGKSGCIVLLSGESQLVAQIRLDTTPQDIADGLRPYRREIAFGILEKVHSLPRDAAKCAFTFGTSYGFVWGLCVASGIRHEFKRPQDWQKAMGCMTGGDKNVSKAKAQALWPTVKVIHANADALLIAEYARRTARERGW